MANNNQNKRVGSFAAINGGVIEGCSANVQLSGCPNGAGFVFGNSGVVKNSVAMRVGRGKGVTGFTSGTRAQSIPADILQTPRSAGLTAAAT